MSGATRSAKSCVAAAALALCACVGPGFDYADLPEEPIIFVFRTIEEAEIVADLMEKRQKDPTKSALDKRISLEEVGRVLGIYDTESDRAASLMGRLYLLHPTSRVREPLQFAQRGARPLGWSHDRRHLLFVRLAGRDSQIYEWSRDTGEIQPRTWGSAAHVDGSYGPDRAVAYARIDQRGSRIWIREPGGNRRVVTQGPADSEPAWSTNGDVLVYRTRGADGREALAAIDPRQENAEPRVLTRGRSPVFTPDGQWVVFSARTRSGWRLFKMRPDGSGRRSMGETSTERQEHDPSVSPDGRFVVYVSERNFRRSLWVRAIDGSGERPLMIEGEGLLPVW